MKNLSKNQIYAILYLKDVKNLPNEEIRSELKLSKERLEQFLENDYNLFTEKNKKRTAKDLMINQTAAKGDKSVAIMTPEASMAIDESQKKASPRKDRYEQFRVK